MQAGYEGCGETVQLGKAMKREALGLRFLNIDMLREWKKRLNR